MTQQTECKVKTIQHLIENTWIVTMEEVDSLDRLFKAGQVYIVSVMNKEEAAKKALKGCDIYYYGLRRKLKNFLPHFFSIIFLVMMLYTYSKM